MTFNIWNRQSKKKNTCGVSDAIPDEQISSHLNDNLNLIKKLTGNSPDIIIRTIENGILKKTPLALVYIEGLTETETINNVIMKSLVRNAEDGFSLPANDFDALTLVRNRIPSAGKIKEVNDMGNLLNELFSGYTIILFDGFEKGISINTAGGERRGVEEPKVDTVVRGPKEGFNENLGTNIALVRRKIKRHNLRLEVMKIGRMTKTDVAIMYINGIANDKIVGEIRRRLNAIDTDSILEGNYIEEFIQDKAFTPFPLIENKERPDTVAASLLEGRVAIFVDGTPYTLLAPATFPILLQSSDDYYQRYDFVVLLRITRYIGFMVSILLPALYIALTTFNQEMLPTTLLISLTAQREAVPFPAYVEALVMEVTLEVLREAGVRLPKTIGTSISIVGALVLGQAAVQAGLVSAAMVIVVSFTAIVNFIIPAYNLAASARILRFGFMILAASFGLFGILVGVIALVIHLSGLRSFGVPYLSSIAPFIPSDQKDIFVRAPWWAMSRRPRLVSQYNNIRQSATQKPSPPNKNRQKIQKPKR